MGGGLGLAHHDEPPVGGGEHLDGGLVEPAQRLAGDHLVRRPGRHPALGDVHDPVEVRQDRVDVVRHHHHAHLGLAADGAHERRHRALVGQVEAVERLVEEQQRGRRTSAWAIRIRCCSPPDSSPMGRSTSAEASTRSMTSPMRSSSARRRCRERREIGQRDAEPVAAEPEPHDVDPPDPQGRFEAAPLGQVPDALVVLHRVAVEHRHRAGRHAAASRGRPSRASTCPHRWARGPRRTPRRRPEVDAGPQGRPPTATAAPRQPEDVIGSHVSVGPSSVARGARQRGLDAPQLVDLPGLEGGAGGSEGLGDRRHRDALAPGPPGPGR